MDSSKDYRVIEILDEYSLIINYGTANGAEKGDVLRILEVGDAIIDPKTGKLLGTLDCIKETVSVEIPYENFSICRSSERENDFNFLSPLNDTLYSSVLKKQPKKLNVDSGDCSFKKVPEKSKIAIGDSVKIFFENH